MAKQHITDETRGINKALRKYAIYQIEYSWFSCRIKVKKYREYPTSRKYEVDVIVSDLLIYTYLPVEEEYRKIPYSSSMFSKYVLKRVKFKLNPYLRDKLMVFGVGCNSYCGGIKKMEIIE